VVEEYYAAWEMYRAQKDRDKMDAIIACIIEKVHSVGGRFMEQNWRKIWVELPEKECRNKVDR